MRFLATAELANGDTVEAQFELDEFAPEAASNAGLQALTAEGATVPKEPDSSGREEIPDTEIVRYSYHAVDDEGTPYNAPQDSENQAPAPQAPVTPITAEEIAARGVASVVTEEAVVTPKRRAK